MVSFDGDLKQYQDNGLDGFLCLCGLVSDEDRLLQCREGGRNGVAVSPPYGVDRTGEPAQNASLLRREIRS
jgi:hypothetical protein